VDPKLWFWTFALANMAAVVALATRGVRAIRAGEIAKHRRSMTAAGWLVVAFLAAYLVKRFAFGPEDIALWAPAARINLWVHEAFVAAMLIAGATALGFGRRIARTRRVTGRDADPVAPGAELRRHRRFGWSAVVAAGLGFVTACGILAGMFARAG
jgi:uncharacterized membrane protein YozB (DUF420 family)